MKTLALLLLLQPAAALAAPTIASVAPGSGPLSGGTAVTIRGGGFVTCPICSPSLPPDVFFGFERATSVQLVDANTLIATTPVHFPGTFEVRVTQFDGSATSPNAFTFVGDITDAFERILLPIFSPPLHGAFGSEFHTIATVGVDASRPISIYGIDTNCTTIDPPLFPENPFPIAPRIDHSLLPACSRWPGRFFYVPKDQAGSVTFNDRVTDVTRTAFSNGTEIPVVRSNRFTTGRLTFLGVPIDGRYRNALRIYSTSPVIVFVSQAGQQPIPVQLQAGPSDFEPAYALFTNFLVPIDPLSSSTIRVTVDPPAVATSNPPPIWAFITVTNNDTQQITTITPDR